MKIIFTTSNDWGYWGGSEELWSQTAGYFLDMGHEVAICIRWDPLPPKLEQLSFRSNCTIISKKRDAVKSDNFFTKRLVRVEEDYKKTILKWNPELAVVSQGNNIDGLELMEFFKQNSIKYVSIVQAVYEGIWPGVEISEHLREVYNSACMNYFVSEANRKLTEVMIACDIHKATIVRNPYNVKYDINVDYPNLEHGYQLACVARYEFYAKGQDVLMEVLNDSIWRKRNITINFYGSGINEGNLINLVKYFDLKNVQINKFTDTTEIWKVNHALILPSRFEGLPLSLVESMLCARFGIVTDVSGNSEVIIDNVSGFLAAAPKPVYLHEAMERAWQKKEGWQEIGKKAQRHIKTLIPENIPETFYNELQKL